MAPQFPILAVAVPLLFLVAGIVLFVVGKRGRVVGGQPVCRRCGFDLTGRPETSTACAECGADLAKPRAVRAGQRFRRRGTLWTGAVLLLLGVASSVLVGIAAVRGTNLNPYKPLWMLAGEVPSSDRAVSNAAAAEIVRRVADGRLSDEQVNGLTDRALKIQGDPTRPWVVGWGDLIEAARANGKLSDADWQRYARQAPNLTLEVRPAVDRDTKKFAYFMVLEPARVGSASRFDVRLDQRAETIWIGDRELAPPPNAFAYRAGTLIANGSSKSGLSIQLAPVIGNLKDGPQTFRIKGKPDIVDARQSSSASSATLASVPFDLIESWLLQPATEATLAFNHDPSHRRAVEAALTVKAVRIASGSLFATIDIGPVPIGLGYEVVARRGDTEWTIGRFSTPAGTAGRSSSMMGSAADFAGDTVDVVLRPSLEVASQSTDTFAIWDGEVVFKDVKVERPGATKP